MSDRIVQALQDLVLEDPCCKYWKVVESGPAWIHRCSRHGASFEIGASCPAGYFRVPRGDQVSVPSKLAEHLVESELAVYPTHQPDEDQGLKATVDRVNALLEGQGLPPTDLEAMGVVRMEGRRNSYRRDPGSPPEPRTASRDRRLASSLGVSAEDVAEMRRLVHGDGPPAPP